MVWQNDLLNLMDAAIAPYADTADLTSFPPHCCTLGCVGGKGHLGCYHVIAVSIEIL